jgi:hypothetical protein
VTSHPPQAVSSFQPLQLRLGGWGWPLSSPSDPEVIEIDKDPVGESNEDPAAGPDPLPDWRILYLYCLIREVLLTDKMKAQ